MFCHRRDVSAKVVDTGKEYSMPTPTSRRQWMQFKRGGKWHCDVNYPSTLMACGLKINQDPVMWSSDKPEDPAYRICAGCQTRVAKHKPSSRLTKKADLFRGQEFDEHWLLDLTVKCDSLLSRKKSGQIKMVRGLIDVNWDDFHKRSTYNKSRLWQEEIRRLESIKSAAKAAFQRYIDEEQTEKSRSQPSNAAMTHQADKRKWVRIYGHATTWHCVANCPSLVHPHTEWYFRPPVKAVCGRDLSGHLAVEPFGEPGVMESSLCASCRRIVSFPLVTGVFDTRWVKKLNKACNLVLALKRRGNVEFVRGLIDVTWDHFNLRAHVDERDCRTERGLELAKIKEEARTALQEYFDEVQLEPSLEPPTNLARPDQSQDCTSDATRDRIGPKQQQSFTTHEEPQPFGDDPKATGLRNAAVAVSNGEVAPFTLAVLENIESGGHEKILLFPDDSQYRTNRRHYLFPKPDLPGDIEFARTDAPVGKSLLGKRIGEEFTWRVDEAEEHYLIKAVLPYVPAERDASSSTSTPQRDEHTSDSTEVYSGRTLLDGCARESLDGSVYIGFTAREDGRFGSHAGHDDYGDESGPEGRDFNDFADIG